MAIYNKRQRRQLNPQATSTPVPPVPAIKTPKKFDFTTPQARSEFGRQQAAPKQSALRPQILKNIQGQLAAGGPDPVVAAQRAAFEQDVGKERKQLVENLQRYGVLGGGASAGATADVLGEFAGQTNIGRLQLGAQEALRRDQALDRAMAFEQANRAAAAQEAGMVGNLGGVQTLAAQQMEAQQGLAQGDLDLRRQALAAEFGIRGSDAAIREAMATEDLLRSGQERGQGRTLFGERVTAGQQFGLQQRGQDLAEELGRGELELARGAETAQQRLAEAALTGQLDDVQTLAASQQAAQQRLAEAGLTGQLDGQRTLAGAESERARRQQTEDLARALQQRQIEGTLFRERVGERERFAGDESLRRAQTGLVGQQAAALTDQRAREAALHRERVSEADRFALEEAASRRAGDLTREQLAGMLAERQLLPGRAALEEDVARGQLALQQAEGRRAGDLTREQIAGMLAERQLMPGRAKLEEDVARGQLGIAEAGSSREGRRLTQDIANQVQQRQIAEALFRERVTDADRFALEEAAGRRAGRQQVQDIADQVQQRQMRQATFDERVSDRDRFALEEAASRRAGDLTREQIAGMLTERQLMPGRFALEEDVARGQLGIAEAGSSREGRRLTEDLARSQQERQIRQATFDERVSEADRFALEERADRRAGDLTREQIAGMLAERQLMPGRAALEEDVARGDLALRQRADQRAGRAQTEELAGSQQERQMRQATFDERVRERERFDQEQRAQNAAIALQREQQAGMLAERQLLPGRAALEEDVARGQLALQQAEGRRAGDLTREQIAGMLAERQLLPGRAALEEDVARGQLALQQAEGRRAGDLTREQIAGMLAERQLLPGRAALEEDVARGQLALQQAEGRRAGDLTREQIAGMLAERQLMPGRFALEEDVARGQLAIGQGQLDLQGELGREGMRQEGLRRTDARRAVLEQAQLERERMRQQDRQFGEEGRRADRALTEDLARSVQDRQIAAALHRERVTDADRFELEGDVARAGMGLTAQQAAALEDERAIRSALHRERVTDRERFTEDQQAGRRAQQALTEDLAGSLQRRQIEGALFRERVGERERFEQERDLAAAGLTGRLGEDDTLQRQALEAELTGRYGEDDTFAARTQKRQEDMDALARSLAAREAEASGGVNIAGIEPAMRRMIQDENIRGLAGSTIGATERLPEGDGAGGETELPARTPGASGVKISGHNRSYSTQSSARDEWEIPSEWDEVIDAGGVVDNMGRLFESPEKMQEYYDLPYGKSGGERYGTGTRSGRGVRPLATGFNRRAN